MTIEEIRELTAEQVEARLSEIETEIDTEGADLEALNAEIDACKERRESLVKAEEERKTLAEKIATDREKVEIKEQREDEKIMSNVEMRNTPEYIDAYANYIKSGDDTECRALLTETASGTVAVPSLVEDIVRTAWEREGIMSRVRKSYLKGILKVGFEKSADPAYIHTEGAAADTEEALVLGTVSISPSSIKKWITISDEVLDMKSEAFLRYIYDELAYQIAKKAADTLVGQIKAAGTSATSTAVGVPAVAVTTVAMDTIAKAIALLSDEATDPVIIMNKQSYPVFKAVQYGANYAADPFEGMEVIFNSTLSTFAAATTGVPYAIVGDLGRGALANYPAGDEITFKFDDLSLAERDLVKIVGREYVGLGIVGPDCFVKITK